MAFKNNLDQPINLYFLYEKDGIPIKRGAGIKEGDQHLSKVEPNSSLELDTDGIGEEYALLTEMEKVPNCQGFRGVKFNPGTSLGTTTNFQVFQRGHEYKVVVNYNAMAENLPGDEDEEIGPDIEYPKPPNTAEPG